MYSSVAEGGGRRPASELWLGGRLSSMLAVTLGGDLDVLELGLGLEEFFVFDSES